jgi:hypothetical protein
MKVHYEKGFSGEGICGAAIVGGRRSATLTVDRAAVNCRECNAWLAARPVHAIRAWSGVAADESPLCGAHRHHVDVAAFRTTNAACVTCAPCRAIQERN